MIENPMDVLRQFPVRKSRKQKQAFRDAIQSYARDLGYRTGTENGNIVIGDPESVRFLIAADARSPSGVVTLLETAVSMPANLRDRVCFVLFDGRRSGAAYHRSKHRYACELQTVLYLDRVWDGDHIMLIPSKAMKAETDSMNTLIGLERLCGEKRVRVWDKGPTFLYAACLPFDRCLSICTLRKNKLFYYPGAREPELDYTNVNILRACLISYIGGASEE